MLSVDDHQGELVVRMPSFWQMMKVGAAFTLGAGLITVVGAFLWMFIITGVIFGTLSNLSSAIAPKRVAPAPPISRSAPPPVSDFEQRVQRTMRERADLQQDVEAFSEALRREQASRRQPAK